MKKTCYILLLLLICICTIIIFRAYHYYAPPQLREPYKVSNQTKNDDTLRIAYIGDSWAYMHKSHNCKIAQIIEDSIHCPVSVQSFGICGLTSKEIYENMYNNNDFREFLQTNGCKYYYISAGINDTYKKMSIHYYKTSMDYIIQFAQKNSIKLIIQEIPDYDIQKSFERQNNGKKILRRLSMYINRTPVDCKQVFRDALDELIHEKGYQNKVSVIRFKSWNNDYDYDQSLLYLDDGLHLNEYGYKKLDSAIAQKILTIIKTGR